MNCLVCFFFAFIISVLAQTELNIQAAGSVPGGSSATARGTGQGANVVGDAIVEVTNTVARSSTVLTATGPTGRAPQLAPQVVVKPTILTTLSVAPICSTIKDKKCPKIDEEVNCGFCIERSYPIKGFACEYYQTLTTNKKVDGVYEVIIVPLCKCDGKFIIEGKACPSCDKLLAALLKCAGSKRTSGAIEIPEKCLKQVGATEKNLKACGFLGEPKTQVMVVEQKKPKVVVVDPQPQVVLVPTTVVVPAVSTATASATATSGANAVATATAGN